MRPLSNRSDHGRAGALVLAFMLALTVAVPLRAAAGDADIATHTSAAEAHELTRTPPAGHEPIRYGSRQGDFEEVAEVDENDLSEDWTERTLDLTPWANTDVCIAFAFQSTRAYHSWYIDDVTVTSEGDTSLEESFDDDEFPPDGWARYALADAGADWERATAHSNSGPASAWHNYDLHQDLTLDGWLVTPSISLGDDPELSYFDRTQFPQDYTYMGVWISTGDCDPRTEPQIELEPAAVSITAEPEGVVTEVVTLGNTAVGALDWHIAANSDDPECDALAGLDWLTVDPDEGSLGPGEDEEVLLSIDTSGIGATTLTAALCIDSTDPLQPRTVLPVTVRVLDEPVVEVSPASIEVTVPTDGAAAETLAISNVGSGELGWSFVAGAPPVRHDNGPLVTGPAAGPDASDLSEVQDQTLGLRLIGSNVTSGFGFRMAEELTVGDPEGWRVDTLTFFVYHQDPSTASTVDSIDYRIWDGPPDDDDSQIVIGEDLPNRLVETEWTGAFRVLESDPMTADFPIMEVVAEGGFTLAEGSYWLDWSVDGSLDSGYWQPPVTVFGETSTGNALQLMADGTWQPLIDPGVDAPQGAPFALTGRLADPTHVCDLPGDISWLDVDVVEGTNGPGESVDVTVAFDSTDLDPATYEALLCVVSNDADTPLVEVPVAVTVTAGDDDGDDPIDPDPPVDPEEPLPEGVVRVSGSNRFETAITISQATFGDGAAGSVVLARADDFADSLAGTPLAVDRDAPVLLTVTDTLIDVVADEITRVLPAGGTVYLLGGTAALDASVEADLIALGYTPVRLAGPERIGTSLAVANELAGDPGEILITNGFNFPDALAAGAAGAEVDGVVILTTPDTPDAQIDAFLTDNPTATVTAVGGPAARAYPDATPVFGPTRETTAVAVADAFFDTPLAIAIARQDDFADALAGGAHIGRLGGPLLLTPDVVLHPDTEAYLCTNAESITTGFVYGGTAAVSDEVVGLITARIDGACG